MVFDWLRSRLQSVQNPTGVDDKTISLIRADLLPLAKLESKIVPRLLSYVIDDEQHDVLLVLRQTSKAAEALKLVRQNPYAGWGTPKARRELFSSPPCNSPAVIFRLAQVWAEAGATGQLTISGFAGCGEWLEVLLSEALGAAPGVWPGAVKNLESLFVWDAEFIEQVIASGEQDPSGLLRGLLVIDPDSYATGHYSKGLLALRGMTGCFDRHPETVLEGLRQKDHRARAHALQCMQQAQADPTPVLNELVKLALGGSKQVREKARPLLARAPQQASEGLETAAVEGNATERFHAVQALWSLRGDEARPFLEERTDKERGKKVKAEIERLLAIEDLEQKRQQEQEARTGAPAAELPPTPSFESDTPLPRELLETLQAAVREMNEAAQKYRAQWWDRTAPEWRRGSRTLSNPIKEGAVRRSFEYLQHGGAAKKVVSSLEPPIQQDSVWKPIMTFARLEPINLVHTLRLLLLTGCLPKKAEPSFPMTPQGHAFLRRFRAERMPELDLRSLASASSAAGLDPEWVARLYLSLSWWDPGNPLDLPPEAIWPFYMEHLEVLEDVFAGGKTGDWQADYLLPEVRKRAFRILAMLPQLPPVFVPMAWEIALGEGKSERPLAQACLERYPHREERIIAALEESKKDIRAAAADWLGRLSCEAAIPALEAALEKEKHEAAKAAMMEALEKLGVPMDKFLNRKRLKEEAERGLGKGVPKDLEWFPFDALPELRWEKTRQRVAPEILSWFVVQSYKLKKPEPGPLLRRYCSLFAPDGREALGRQVLEAWLTHDTRPAYNHEQASKLAEKDVQQAKQWAKKWPQHYQDWDEQQYRQTMLNQYLHHCLGSAISSKGVLALVGACAGPEIVPAVGKYLKDWYGHRLAQAKALIQMLSWVDHPLAIQLLLSVGTRFRTKGIQAEAAKYAEILAERKGWTRDELGDRTMPTAGFDENGVMEIDYGTRRFSARLAEDFSVQLQNQAGKTIKSLPDANKSEEADEVKAIKKRYTAAKKELKQVLKLQQERLYEAMCTGRSWRVEDWDLYLNRHPIVGRYCQRLVWTAEGPDESSVLFRPLADRTLTDRDDEQLTLEPDRQVKLAHGSLVSPEEGEAWLGHLGDYEIRPLFEQFGRSLFVVGDDTKDATEIRDFEGHMIGTFKLRSLMGKLGYVRGESEDAGWFYTYHKSFPGLRLRAVIEFTGNYVPEEDRPAALTRLTFERQREEGTPSWHGGEPARPLGQLSPVLVSECWNDLRSAAEAGSGFDPDWEKKTTY